MPFQAILKGITLIPQIQSNRMHHCYRPIRYCDWYKPKNEFYYVLRCPPCPTPKCRPAITCEKKCKVCSFWQQLKDNCCGFFWPLPPLPMKSEARVYICKDMRKKVLKKSEAKKRLAAKTFPMHDCYDIPDCPEPNWEALRPK